MARRATVLAVTLLALGLVAGRAPAQETPEPEAAKPAVKADGVRPEAKAERPTPRPERIPTTMLQVQLVISRIQGERKIASLPYTFLAPAIPIGAPEGTGRMRMRMGVDTPVPKTAVVGDTKNSVGTTEVQYRNVGTNLDGWVNDLGDGRYQLRLTVENSSALPASDAGSNPAAATGFPLFRRFETYLNPILKAGQSVQAVASTDPVTGEVIKIDVTLAVVK